jgi:hypothetical protein
MAETNVSSGSYTAGRRRSKPPFARTIRPSSADEPIPAVDALRDQRPQWPTNRRSGCFGNRQLIGHFRHWGRSGSTSAMWRIAGSGSIEQSNGQLPGSANSHSRPLADIRATARATAVSKVQRTFVRAGRLPSNGISCRSMANRDRSAGSLLPVAHDTIAADGGLRLGQTPLIVPSRHAF